MRRVLWVLLVAASLAGCGDDAGETDVDPGLRGEGGATPAATEKPADWPPADARRLAPDRAPTPYTVEQIRAGCRDGRVCVYRLDVRGMETLESWRFDEGDDQGVRWTSTKLAPDGSPAGEGKSRRHEWVKLQRHASYPAAQTEISEETIEVPAGRFACMLYTVTKNKPMTRTKDGKQVRVDRVAVSKRWFAWALPGPPVKMEEHVAGTRTTLMELVSTGYERDR